MAETNQPKRDYSVDPNTPPELSESAKDDLLELIDEELRGH